MRPLIFAEAPHAVNSSITRKIQNLRRPSSDGPKKCRVYLHLPWLGATSTRFKKQVTSAVQRSYFSTKPRVVFTTRRLLPASTKDVLPAFQQSNIVYEFLDHCDSRDVCRTSQRLQDRIMQHVPKSVRTGQFSQDSAAFNCSCKLTNHEPSCDSAIGQHLLTNQSCASHYSDDRFSILSKGYSAFHLSALEATYIEVSQPILCRRKEFVYALKISRWRFCF